MMGPPGQIMGDFVLNDQGLTDVITRLMESAGAGPEAPRPATEEIIKDLPRQTMSEESLGALHYLLVFKLNT